MPGGPVATGGGISADGSKNKLAGILMVSFAAFAGMLFGYDTGTIAGITAMKDWLRLFGKPTDDLTNHPTGFAITSAQQSLVTSILSAGTFFGKSRSTFSLSIGDARHTTTNCARASLSSKRQSRFAAARD